jgi:uncharacterized membrane protein
MNNHTLSIMIGGIAAAVLLGVSGVFQKSAHGISQGPYLVVVGVVISLVGCAWWLVTKESSWTLSAIGYSSLFALFWALATGCIAIGLSRYGGNISQIAPLYNMNTLVVVLIGLCIMGEYRTVNPVNVSIGSLLVVAGGIMATRG